MKLSFWRQVSAIFLAVLLAVSTPVLAVSETMDDAVVNTVAPSVAPVETVVPEETEAPAELDETTDSPTPGTDDTVTPSPDPSVTYKLTFNGNGAKLTTAIAGSYTSKTLYAAGTEVNLTTALDGKRFAMALSADYSTNYLQLGWNTAKDGSGTHYDMGATFVMPEGDTTLYAEWESFEWLHWEAVLAEGGESITIHEGATGKTEKTGASFKLFTGNYGNQYGKVPAAYYTPVVATAKAGYLFTGWYDGETLVSESNTLTTQDFRNLRALKFAERGAKLEARFEKLPTITYTDGVGGKAFADQVYYVKVGEATPAFDGEPTRANCEFTGWTPEVAETVTGDATYTATWKVLEPAVPSGSNSSKELFKFHCTTDSEAHVDQTYNWFGSYVKYNGDMAFDEARGVYTATAKITNVQTLLSTGVSAPNKVWGNTHYHTDENGNKVMTAAIKLVWNPDAGLWEPDGEQLVNVWHATAPAAPTLAGLPKSTKSSTAVRVQNASVPFSASNTRDSVDSNVHYFQYLKAGTYEFSEVTKDENGDFWCTLKITDFEPFVWTFNHRNSNPTPAFSIDTEKTTANFTWKLKYIGSKTDYKTDGTGWSIDSSSWANGETAKTGKLLYVDQFYTVTYTDGANGEAFADQVTKVKANAATPTFNGTPTRTNYDFTGWTPEVAETVTGDATYTATWKVLEPAVPSGSNSSKELFKFHCTTDSEAHVDQTYNWFGSYVKYNGDMAFDEARGVYTATAKITNVQTLLSTGVSAPNKVWGNTHYHTDENGNKVMTAAIKLVWNPDAGLWEPDGEQLVNVWHATAPAAPTLAGLPKSTKSSTAVRVQNASVPFSASNTRDSVDSNVHYFQYLKAGTYEFSEVTKDENGDFWCTLKITDFAPYVANFNTRNSNPTPAFVIDTDKTTADFTWKLKYTGSKTDYKVDGTGWSIDSSSWAKGETSRTGKLLYVDQFYTVTYTDGANGEAFADQTYTVRNGSATPAFNGSLTREGYVFNGWTPEVAEKVYADVTYTAAWAEDKNGNGVADDKDPRYTVTYTDGVEDEVVFEDETYADQLVGMPTPAFSGDTTRKGYVFKGWNPAVTDTVTDNVTYVAVWGVDKNNNGIDDADETHYTVTYTDGVEKKEIFADQVYEGLVVGEATPAFNGTPTRKGYKFGGWEPKVAEAVTDNAVYTAKWIKIEDTDDVPKTGDFATAPAALLASSLTFLGLGVVLSIESRKAKKNNH